MTDALGRRGLSWSPLPAAAVCLLLIFLPEAALLRETTFWPLLLSIVLVLVGLSSARPAGDRRAIHELTTGAKLVLVFVGAVLTAVFWLRAWMALPTVWLGHKQLLLVQVAAFWWPAVLFAALCRQHGQGLRPPGRGHFMRQLAWGLLGAGLGVLVQLLLLGILT